MLHSALLPTLDAGVEDSGSKSLSKRQPAGRTDRFVSWSGALAALLSLSQLLEWGWMKTRYSDEPVASSAVAIALSTIVLGPALAMWIGTDTLRRAWQTLSVRYIAAWWLVGMAISCIGYGSLLGNFILGHDFEGAVPLSVMLVFLGWGTVALSSQHTRGWPSERLVGSTIFALVAPLSYAVAHRLTEAVWRPSIIMTMLVVSASVTAALLATWRWLRLEGVAGRDDTEATLGRLLSELESLRQSLDRAEQCVEQRTRFLSRLSHELRTPLTTMIGFSQLLDIDAKEPLTVSQRHKNSYVIKSGALLQRLVDDMSNLSNVDRDDLSVERQQVEVRGIVEAVVGMMAPVARRHGVDLREPSASGSCRVWADEQRLTQILLNLVGNAIKYNRQGGAVWITVKPRCDQTIEIGVHDSGHGIDPSRMSQLFEPFNRLGRETSDIPGTGLGLAHCKLLAVLMGGHIEATSQLEEGTHMALALPAVVD